MDGKLRNMASLYLMDGEKEMPYTAKYVVEHFLKEGRKNKKLYVGVASESGIVWTELEEF